MYNKFISLCTNSTAVIISHRLSSVSMADRIFLLRDGEIAEVGIHRELIDLDGEYARLFNIQTEAYKALEIRNKKRTGLNPSFCMYIYECVPVKVTVRGQ
ncbi:hypothetical protein [Sporomusa ovata]|uniref:ABC transporter ATP-binding protein n=2 Tax=Sporomusa ovata TaxID=2378 RepID=A0A0U1L053_9FIRM|nr:hypothetical protein [Sporomusa ovata]CQR72553.1 ABC transporter ATP-binding protein [Sporomusa ovata]